MNSTVTVRASAASIRWSKSGTTAFTSWLHASLDITNHIKVVATAREFRQAAQLNMIVIPIVGVGGPASADPLRGCPGSCPTLPAKDT